MGRVRQVLARWERAGVRCLCLVSCVLAVWQWHEWQRLGALGAALRSGEGLAVHAGMRRPEVIYALGWWDAMRGDWRAAARRFVELENVDDRAWVMRAKLALGNVYFDLARKAGTPVAGVARMNQLARFDLAREAYRAVLRIDPGSHAARHNLELLERSVPERRIRGWQRDTDGVSLQPFKRNGWTGMREKPKRGLP